MFKVYLLRVPSLTDTRGYTSLRFTFFNKITVVDLISVHSIGYSQVKVMEVGVVVTALRLVGGGRGAIVKTYYNSCVLIHTEW